MEQLKAIKPARMNLYFDAGLMIFLVALAKKAIVADGLVRIIDPVIRDKAALAVMTGLEVWCFALLGTLQVYFDYSAYCDMAVGIGLMLGIVLPMNFNSPLRTRNFVEFWRCWNITLTNFFTETIFYPISLYFARRKLFGSNAALKYAFTVLIPISLTFFATGIWHGAGLNFIYFALVNALGVTVVRLLQKLGAPRLPFFAAYGINMLYFAILVVCFRESDTGTLETTLGRMLTPALDFFSWKFSWHEGMVLGSLVILGYAFVLYSPNILEIFARDILNLKNEPSRLERTVVAVYATVPGRIAVAILTFFCLVSVLNPTFFVYFQF